MVIILDLTKGKLLKDFGKENFLDLCNNPTKHSPPWSHANKGRSEITILRSEGSTLEEIRPGIRCVLEDIGLKTSSAEVVRLEYNQQCFFPSLIFTTNKLLAICLFLRMIILQRRRSKHLLVLQQQSLPCTHSLLMGPLLDAGRKHKSYILGVPILSSMYKLRSF